MERVKEEVIIADYSWFYAGFWIRLAAWVIDAIISSIIMGIFADAAPMFGLLLVFAYFVGFWTWRGQTLGKMALGVRVVTTDGKSLNFGTAILRLVGYFISGIILYIGYIMIGFDKRKQGLHDKMANTYVISKKGETRAEAMHTDYMKKIELWESVGLDVTDIKKTLE